MKANNYLLRFVKPEKFRDSFSLVSLRTNGIHADVVITPKEKNGEPYGK